MATLPRHAASVKRMLSANRSHRLFSVSAKLLVDTPPLVAMWRTLEKRETIDDDLWVWSFLEAAEVASDLPPYHYLAAGERRKLAQTVSRLASRLAGVLETQGLDTQLVHNDGKLFNGFFFYEDFGDSNRARIDAGGTNKVKMSALIKGTAERANQKIMEEPLRGKAGRNVRAIRFVRLIVKRNLSLYREPLNAVVAAAANAMFRTSYGESDVRKLLSR